MKTYIIHTKQKSIPYKIQADIVEERGDHWRFGDKQEELVAIINKADMYGWELETPKDINEE